MDCCTAYRGEWHGGFSFTRFFGNVSCNGWRQFDTNRRHARRWTARPIGDTVVDSKGREGAMKRWIAQAAVVVVAGCAAAPTHESLDYVTRSKTGEGPTTEELVNDQRSPDDVLTYGMGYSQQRY